MSTQLTIRIPTAPNSYPIPTEFSGQRVQIGAWQEVNSRIGFYFKNSIYNNDEISTRDIGTTYAFNRLSRCLIDDQTHFVPYVITGSATQRRITIPYASSDRWTYLCNNTSSQLNDFVSACPSVENVPSPISGVNKNELYRLLFITDGAKILGVQTPETSSSTLPTSVNVPSEINIERNLTTPRAGFRVTATAFTNPVASWHVPPETRNGTFSYTPGNNACTIQPIYSAYFGFPVIYGVTFDYNTETHAVSNITLKTHIFYIAYSIPYFQSSL